MHSVDHRHDILYRGAALHDVDGVEDVAAVGREDLRTLEHLTAHLFRRAERQDLLGVDAAAPEGDVLAIGFLEVLRVHARSRALHRVERVEAASMNSGMIGSTAPQLCLRVFQLVWLWIQSLIFL